MKRLVAAVFCAMLLVMLLPTATFAAVSSTAIQFGADVIDRGDMVWLGKYSTGGTDYDVPWQVLNTDSDSGSVFLLSECLLGNSKFETFSSGNTSPIGYYNDSTLNDRMDDLYNGTNTLFTSGERGAIVKKTNLSCADDVNNDANSPAVPTAYLYPMSSHEATAPYLGARILRPKYRNAPTGSNGRWWLRSSESRTRAFCATDTTVNSYLAVGESIGVRPAFDLDKSAVLFTSYAVGGKSTTGMDTGFLPLPGPTSLGGQLSMQWKLTLKDASRNGFSITTMALSSDSATIRYSGAKTGAHEYISAVIVNNSRILYYGRFKSLQNQADASGTVTINIPSNVVLNENTQLKVFNEQFNGDRTSADISDASRAYTDYASKLLTVTEPAGGPAVPKTGDNTPLAPLIWLMLLAGAGLAASAMLRRRKRQNGL